MKDRTNRPKVVFTHPGMTQVQFLEDCDINNIMKIAKKTGMVEIPNGSPLYGDFSGIDSYQDALEKLEMAKTDFYNLDPKVRNRFGNRPEELIEFLKNKNNRKEAEELGLVKKAPVVEPVVNEPAAPAAAQ